MKKYKFKNGKEVLVDVNAPITVGDLYIQLDSTYQYEPHVCCHSTTEKALARRIGDGKFAKIVDGISQFGELLQFHFDQLKEDAEKAKKRYMQAQLDAANFCAKISPKPNK